MNTETTTTFAPADSGPHSHNDNHGNSHKDSVSSAQTPKRKSPGFAEFLRLLETTTEDRFAVVDIASLTGNSSAQRYVQAHLRQPEAIATMESTGWRVVHLPYSSFTHAWLVRRDAPILKEGSDRDVLRLMEKERERVTGWCAGTPRLQPKNSRVSDGKTNAERAAEVQASLRDHPFTGEEDIPVVSHYRRR